MGRPKLVQGHPLDDAGPRGLIQVDDPTPATEESSHPFDQVSRLARADARLSDRAYRVLATIEGHCWGDGRACWATNRTIGKLSGGVGPEAVRRAIRELERLGYLRVEADNNRMRGQRLVLLYQLRKPDLPPLDLE